MTRKRVACLAGLVLAFAENVAAAKGRTAYFTLAIGFNGAPPESGTMEALRYADDDAASVYRLAREVGHTAILLADIDTDTRRRVPELADDARPPTLVELAKALTQLNQAIDLAATRGDETALLFFYSGHGVRGGEGGAGLVLADGRLTHDRLYEDVLAKVHASGVNLIVDACHAEAVVRPRDLNANTVETPTEDLRKYLERRTLARFPRVGAIVASTSADETHEWDTYRSGVFTHEVLSALRGGADIDGDHRIEYSELAAFLAAANRDVLDLRARPSTLVHPPQSRPRTALIELATSARASTLVGVPAAFGLIYVEDARGNRLASLHAEPGHRLSLLLPAGIDLFVRSKNAEAEAQLDPRGALAFERLAWKPVAARARGAVEHSLRQGLFASRFGPAYYSGFVDRSDGLVAVTVPAVEPAPAFVSTPKVASRGAYLAWGAAVPLGAAAAVFGALAYSAHNDLSTAVERDATAIQDRLATFRALSITSAVAAIASGVIGYYLSR